MLKVKALKLVDGRTVRVGARRRGRGVISREYGAPVQSIITEPGFCFRVRHEGDRTSGTIISASEVSKVYYFEKE